MRLALRKIRKEHPEDKENIKEIMRDQDKLAMLEEEMQGQANCYGVMVGGAMDWFNYLVENWEMVLKAISVIILLVGKEGDV